MTERLLPIADSHVDEALGQALHAFADELYPICRSITGNGVRQTLALINQRIPLETHEVPSGTQAFDWTIPREWNIRDAWIRDRHGNKIVDFRKHNLSVLNYSMPVSATMTLAELKPHLYSLPDQPDAIPYRTSYHQEAWGFCLPHRQLMALDEGPYEVVIDSTLEPGHLTYGECLLPGELPDEVLVSCHVCHPSLSDDNLSGIVVATELARYLATVPHRFSYRFLFVPGTIGSIAWLARNEAAAQRIRHGVVLTCVGDAASFTYKRSRRGAADIDLAFEQVLRHLPAPGALVDFSPYGYDERQYCSPGFNLAVGCLMRGVHGEFPEYHTSNDNPGFLKPHSLAETVSVLQQVFEVLEHNATLRNTKPFCEPQLGKRGLYRTTGGTGPNSENMAMLWLLNQCDGSQSLLDVARRSGLAFRTVVRAAQALAQAQLLVPVG